MSLEWLGFIALGIAIGSFQVMLDRGQQLDWLSSTEILVEAAVAALAFYLFLVNTFTRGRGSVLLLLRRAKRSEPTEAILE